MTRLVAVCARAALLAVVVSATSIGQTSSPQSSASPILELRLADTMSGPGFSVRRELEGVGRPNVFYLASEGVVGDADIAHARTRQTADGIAVEIRLSESAAARLRETTASNIGKYLAVIVRGRLMEPAPIVGAVPRGNALTVGVQLARAEADSVRSRIASRWAVPPR